MNAWPYLVDSSSLHSPRCGYNILKVLEPYLLYICQYRVSCDALIFNDGKVGCSSKGATLVQFNKYAPNFFWLLF
jgi:hypothetical protein